MIFILFVFLHLSLCNECIVGAKGASVCDCRRNCTGIGDDFKEKCLESAVGMIQIAQCIDQAHEIYVDCLKECGPQPTFPEIVNIEYRFNTAWSPIGQDSRLARRDWQQMARVVECLEDFH